MSYDNSATAVRRLEDRFERLLLIIGDMQAAIGRMQQPALNPAGGQQGSGGGGIYLCLSPTAGIPANNSSGPLTGKTISIVNSGTTVTVSTNGSIYNFMNSATVITKTLAIDLNSDGTFTVITQSC